LIGCAPHTRRHVDAATMRRAARSGGKHLHASQAAATGLAELTVAPQTLTRKLVHIISGTGFLLTWLLFRCAALRHRRPRTVCKEASTLLSALTPLVRSDSSEARYIAACVPLANGVRLAAIGSGVLRNDAAVKAISREGDPK